MARVLLLVSTTSYRTEDFVAAAVRAGAEAVIGSDRCHMLDGVYQFPEDSLMLDLRHKERAAEAIVDAAAARPFDAIVPTSDLTAEIAAMASARLGLVANPPDAAYTARNKLRMREALSRAGVPCPRFCAFGVDEDAERVAAAVAEAPGYPCVVKPLLLSASRGVIRADDPASFVRAFARLRAILTTPEMRAAAAEDADGARVLVESFQPGQEIALEGILARGRLHVLAIFDKPDPLDGPFFEETIYVTPSRHAPAAQRALGEAAARAAAAMGLVEGPLHAELRLAPDGPYVIEAAARTIGGLCGRALRFSLGDGEDTLEDLVIGHALGRLDAPPPRAGAAAGVMMLPIPAAGVLQAVDGEEAARAVPGIIDVAITIRAGEKLVPLPEGSSYLGFVFARGRTPDEVEAALRSAHARLRFTIAPLL